MRPYHPTITYGDATTLAAEFNSLGPNATLAALEGAQFWVHSNYPRAFAVLPERPWSDQLTEPRLTIHVRHGETMSGIQHMRTAASEVKRSINRVNRRMEELWAQADHHEFKTYLFSLHIHHAKLMIGRRKLTPRQGRMILGKSRARYIHHQRAYKQASRDILALVSEKKELFDTLIGIESCIPEISSARKITF